MGTGSCTFSQLKQSSCLPGPSSGGLGPPFHHSRQGRWAAAKGIERSWVQTCCLLLALRPRWREGIEPR